MRFNKAGSRKNFLSRNLVHHRRSLPLESLESRRVLAALFEADFTDDDDLAEDEGFVVAGDLWHLSTGRGDLPGHSGPDSFYFGENENSLGGGTYGINRSGTITSPVIDLTGQTAVELRFNHFLELEKDYDFASVHVLHSGTSTTIATSGTELPFATGVFDAVALDLSSFAGQMIQIQFEVEADFFETGDEGWYVDDIVVGDPIISTALDFSDANGNPDAEGFTSSGTNDLWHLSIGRGSDAGHSSNDSFYFGRNEGPDGGVARERSHRASGRMDRLQ